MNKFQFFELFGEIDPAFVAAAEEILEREEQPRPVFNRRKVFSAALLAAVLAVLLTVTAYAAGLFELRLQFPRRGETQSYSFTVEMPDGESLPQTAEAGAGLILRFDSQSQGTLCAFCPGWLPTEPTQSFSLAEEAGDLARARLGMHALPSDGEERALADEETEKVLKEMGLSAEEAALWSVWCDADPALAGEAAEAGIPYQISLSNCSDLYELDLLIGGAGESVELLKDETEGEERTLWLRVSKEGQNGDSLYPYHAVLRFSQSEGWLLQVIGSLDAETLGKIAENTEIKQTAYRTEAERTERGFGIVSLSRG